MGKEFKLKPVTAEAEALVKDCPRDVIKFYENHLPYWDFAITEEIRGVLAPGKFPNREKSIENIRYYYPLVAKFTLSFIPKLLIEISNLHRLAAEMMPIAFAVDAYFREREGQAFSDISKKHFEGIRAWYYALNIYGYYNKAIQKEFTGKEIAKIIIGRPEKYINLKKMGKNQSEIRSALNLEISQKLNNSAEDASRLSDDPFIKDYFWDNSQPLFGKLIDTFSDKSQQLKDAIDGHYRYVIRGARRTVRRAAGLKEHGFIGDGLAGDGLEEIQDFGRPRFKQGNPLVDAFEIDSPEAQPFMVREYYYTKEQEKREEALAQARAELRADLLVKQKVKDVMRMVFSDPDKTDAELGEKLGITRKTVGKHKEVGFNYLRKKIT